MPETTLGRELNKKQRSRYIQDAPLSYGQAFFWIYAALEQSRILANDATILFKRGSPATALNLLFLAQEEISKPSIILEYMAKGIRDQDEWSEAKKRLLSHGSKIETSTKLFLQFLQGRKKRPEIYRILRGLKKMQFNPVQAFKNTREASIYTFAYEGSVLVPPRIGHLGAALMPSHAGVIASLAGDLVDLIEANFPSAFVAMKALFYAKTDEEVDTCFRAYELVIEKHIYLLSFTQTYFEDWQAVFKSLVEDKKIPFLLRRLGPKKQRRKYQVFFELMKRQGKLSDLQRKEFLLHEKLPKVAKNVFLKMKAKKKLLRG